MSHRIDDADRDTHVRVVAVGLTISVVVAWLAIATLPLH